MSVNNDHVGEFFTMAGSLAFRTFTILSTTHRNSDMAESALPTAATLGAATRSPGGSLGGASRGSWSAEMAPLHHCQWRHM